MQTSLYAKISIAKKERTLLNIKVSMQYDHIVLPEQGENVVSE